MGPKLENLDVNGSADEVTEYTDWLNFRINTNEASYKKQLKAFFLRQSGRKHSPYPKTLRDVSIPESCETLLRYARPAQFELV